MTYCIARELEKDDSNFEEPQAVSAFPFDANCDTRVQALLHPSHSNNSNASHHQNVGAGGGGDAHAAGARDGSGAGGGGRSEASGAGHTRARVHDHVGYEPSGRAYNEFVLNINGLPHNPLINAGAIMVASLIKPKHEPSQRFEHILKIITKMGGNLPGISFDNSTYLSEKRHADRNISLAHYMRENRAFVGYPTTSEIGEHMDLYFQACSVSINSKVGAVMAATMANSGICPITEERVIASSVVKDCLSIMYTCGMYEASGLFSFHVGLPAKSGVSGCILLCVPRVGGFCIWSPRLDGTGNSTRAIQFALEFTRRTRGRYHMFRSALLASTPSSLGAGVGRGEPASATGKHASAKLAAANAGASHTNNSILWETETVTKADASANANNQNVSAGESGDDGNGEANPLAYVSEEVLINRLMHATEANPRTAVEVLNSLSQDEEDYQDMDDLRANTTVHTAHGSLFFFEHLLEEVVQSLKYDDETTAQAYLRVLSMSNSDKKTCLHIAAAEGKVDFVAYILRQGVTADMKDRWGNTPAFEARKMLQQLQEAYTITYGQVQQDGGLSYIEEYFAARNREVVASASETGDVSHGSGGSAALQLEGSGTEAENEEEELDPEDKMLQAIFDYDQIVDMLVSGIGGLGKDMGKDSVHSVQSAHSGSINPLQNGAEALSGRSALHSTHSAIGTHREFSSHREHRDRDRDHSTHAGMSYTTQYNSDRNTHHRAISPSLFHTQHLQHVRSSDSVSSFPFNGNRGGAGGTHGGGGHANHAGHGSHSAHGMPMNPFASHTIKDHTYHQHQHPHSSHSGLLGHAKSSGSSGMTRRPSNGALSDADARTHTLHSSIGSHDRLPSFGGSIYNSANPAVRDRNRDGDRHRDTDSHREREKDYGLKRKDRDSGAGAGTGSGRVAADVTRREPDNGYGVQGSRSALGHSASRETSDNLSAAAGAGDGVAVGQGNGTAGSSPVKSNYISRMGTASSTSIYRSTSDPTHTASASHLPPSFSSPSVRFALPHVKTPLPPPPSNVANLVSPSPTSASAQHASNSNSAVGTTTTPSASNNSNSPVKDTAN